VSETKRTSGGKLPDVTIHAMLIPRSHEVPHKCDDPNCPGNVNRRKLATFDKLLEACKAAQGLVEICEEIGYAGEHDCFCDGHAMIKTRDGEYVRAHCRGGYLARDRIVEMIRSAIAEAERKP